MLSAVAPNLKRAIAGTALFSKLPPTGNRDDDLVDVAAVLLEGDSDELPPFNAGGKLSLPLERIATQEAPRVGRPSAFLGFPASKGKADRIDLQVRSGMYSYLASSSPSEVYTKLGFDERFHIVLPFQKRNVITLDGGKFNFPALQGMSGSPLWELRRAEDGGRRAVGVMIRDKHKRDHVVVAVDIYAVARMVAEHFRNTGLIA